MASAPSFNDLFTKEETLDYLSRTNRIKVIECKLTLFQRIKLLRSGFLAVSLDDLKPWIDGSNIATIPLGLRLVCLFRQVIPIFVTLLSEEDPHSLRVRLDLDLMVYFKEENSTKQEIFEND